VRSVGLWARELSFLLRCASTIKPRRASTMKPTALHIERWLDGVEARIVPPERRGLRVIIHEGDDEAAAMEKAVAEHIAAHPEDAGRTVKDFRWVVWEIVREPQEDGFIADNTDEADDDAAVSETPLMNGSSVSSSGSNGSTDGFALPSCDAETPDLSVPMPNNVLPMPDRPWIAPRSASSSSGSNPATCSSSPDLIGWRARRGIC
jgi:hypothetical protein